MESRKGNRVRTRQDYNLIAGVTRRPRKVRKQSGPSSDAAAQSQDDAGVEQMGRGKRRKIVRMTKMLRHKLAIWLLARLQVQGENGKRKIKERKGRLEREESDLVGTGVRSEVCEVRSERGDDDTRV